ncbi:hypothetical protein CBL_00271 [Carabus blaptoides fortunei]
MLHHHIRNEKGLLEDEVINTTCYILSTDVSVLSSSSMLIYLVQLLHRCGTHSSVVHIETPVVSRISFSSVYVPLVTTLRTAKKMQRYPLVPVAAVSAIVVTLNRDRAGGRFNFVKVNCQLTATHTAYRTDVENQ